MTAMIHRMPPCHPLPQKTKRIYTVLLLPLIVFGCETRIDDDALPTPQSAIVELRDAPSERELVTPTQVIVLGTGTPIPDATRAGPGIAVIHRGEAYLFDAGAGVARNATRARYKYDIPSLYPTQICCLFLTHLHNDHTQDLSELATSLWWRRPRALRVWGPVGLQEMAAAHARIMAPDVAIRSFGSQPLQNAQTYRIDATEIAAGVVFEKDDLLVEAFEVDHGEVNPAFGFRITTDDKTIVISGDTAYSDTVLEMSRDADILFHEVISDAGLLRNSRAFQEYHRRSHTPASDVARLAAEARPGLLVLYHGLFYGLPESVVVDEVNETYNGAVVLANDLDRF